MKLRIHVTNEDGVQVMEWTLNSQWTQKIIQDDIVAFADALATKVAAYKWPDNTKENADESDTTSD